MLSWQSTCNDVVTKIRREKQLGSGYVKAEVFTKMTLHL